MDMGVVSLVFSIIALGVAVVTLPTAFQMFWGAPKLSFEFTDRDKDGARVLLCSIRNEPINNWLLKRLGVRRTAAEICGDFAVYKAGTKEVIAHLIRPIINNEKERGRLISVAQGIYGARFVIVMHSQEGATIPSYDAEETGTPIGPGKYYVCIRFSSSDQTIYCRKQNLIIGHKVEGTFWNGDPVKISPEEAD